MTRMVRMGYAPTAFRQRPRALKGDRNPHGVCLLHPIRTVRAALSATSFASLGKLPSSHRAITRVALATLSLTVIAGLSQQPAVQAGPETTPVAPESLLPQNVGVAVDTRSGITIPFEAAMDPASVESAAQLLPEQAMRLSWNEERTVLTIAPERLWRTDEQYLVVIGAAAETADGTELSSARRFAFTTATAPAVTDFQVHLAPADLAAKVQTVAAPTATLDADAYPLIVRVASPEPPDDGSVSQPPTRTAEQVSASSSITIDFSAAMDQADVEDRFTITPAVERDLTWRGRDLVFSPTERLEPGARYTISVIGSHDMYGNPLGGKGNFSFIVQAGAELTKTDPGQDAAGVETAKVSMWFSQPMDRRATNQALRVTDLVSGATIEGKVSWNEESTQLTFTPTAAFGAGTTIKVSLGKSGGRDADGNVVKAVWSFGTAAPPPVVAPARTEVTVRSAPSIPAPAPSADLAQYALNQVNAARTSKDLSLAAHVASAHAWDQARNNYFSHYGLDGSTRESRLAAGGVSFGYSGENQCYRIGLSQRGTLDWCHAAFMAEPYPGYWNHIANILDPRFTRMGVGIATIGSKTVITWDFTD